MARSEALPQQELLAHLSLARARRLSRHAHLALRILGALERIAPPAFVPLLAWELLMAGDRERAAAVLACVSRRDEPAAHTLGSLIDAALRGDRGAFHADAADLSAAVSGVSFLARDCELLLCALDHRAAPTPQSALHAWLSGAVELPPPEIHALCVSAGANEEDAETEAYVLATNDGTPRRGLGLGHRLCGAPDLVRLRRSRRRHGRLETIAAVVALAGARGVSLADAFERAYGFAYEPEVHHGVFEVLLHRLRAYLQTAELVREEGRLRLSLRAPLLVPDPRCAAPAYDRLLRILAREGRATAHQAAQKAGLSLRAVQEALKSLTEEGACNTEKAGRHVHYVVEDTTFSEPTALLSMNVAKPT
jgi:hypothetical protein